ncbi:MAG TPA: OmpA family protein [Bacteroidia bacterium]|jgi:outer membrane protein OmpA-like peptidoglycan-associated protein|nr:OmpA family protein [Bacteroidia bacterium]
MKKVIYLLLFLPFTQLLAQNNASDELKATEDMALLKVVVVNASGKPLEGEKASFIAEKGGKTYSGITNSEGQFKLLVPEGDKYKVRYQDFADDKDYKTLDMPNKPGTINFTFTIKILRDQVTRLDNVTFESGKANLRPESNKALNDLAEFMARKKNIKIEIAGHTDNVGDKDANQKLSQERAASVKAYLVKKGISTDRVIAKGYGDTQPMADNDTPEGKQKNRRTEIRVLGE